MSGNFAIKGGGVGRLMANAILNFHFDFLTTSLMWYELNPRVRRAFGNVWNISPSRPTSQLGSCIPCQRKSPVEKKCPESDVKINCREQRAGLEPDMRLGLANKQERWLVYCDLILASYTTQHPKYLCEQFFPTLWGPQDIDISIYLQQA